MIVDHAIASLADKVHVGLTHSALWARLAGGPRGVDLVIDLAADGVGAAREQDNAGSVAEVKSRGPRPAAASRASRSVLVPGFSRF
jgi:hypothetical protein